MNQLHDAVTLIHLDINKFAVSLVAAVQFPFIFEDAYIDGPVLDRSNPSSLAMESGLH